MTFAKLFLISIFSIYVTTMLLTFLKTKKFITTLILSAMQGICALFAINLLGQYISVHIPINGWTIGISSSGGIGGVIMLLFCDVFMC